MPYGGFGTSNRGQSHVARHHLLVAALLVGGLLTLVCAAAGALFLVGSSVNSFGSGLGGMDVSEQDLAREEQVSMIEQFAPIPTPTEASDIRLRYRRFQDWHFEASFVLPATALDGYVSQLGPRLPDAPGFEGWERYAGKRIGPHAGEVRVERGAGRVVVSHASS